MNQHSRFDLPLCLVVEEDAFSQVDENVKKYIPEIMGKKTIVVTEENLINIFGEKIEEIRKDFGNAEIFNVEQADYDEAAKLAKDICVKDIKVVIGFGGGRVLDVAKYAAYISKAVYICLPTTLSNDSLASPFSVLGTEGVHRKTLEGKIPAAIIVDTDVIINAPKSQTLSGIGDTLSKYTALYDYAFAAEREGKLMNDFAYAIGQMSFDSVYHHDNKSLTSKAFIKSLSRALVMGGLAMEIAGSSRPCSGSEHLFAHAIEEYYPDIRISHGLAVALGSIGACIFQGRDEMGLIQVCKEYGLDINPETYGITKDIFADIWTRAEGTRPGRISILSETDLNREWLDTIYDKMVNA